MTNTCHINIDDFKPLFTSVRDSIKNIIKDNETYINTNRFTEFYNRQSTLPYFEIGILTSLLYAAGIDPLPYMQKIPEHFLYNSEISGDFIIPDSVTGIGAGAFYSCKNLKNITLPSNLISIGDFAFYKCIGLTSITIPDSVTWIGSSAFHNCTSLTSVTIPDSVTWIGSQAFYNCIGLKSITYQSTIAQWNAISKAPHWNSNTGNYIIYCTDGDIKK